MGPGKIRVLIVDDTFLYRKILRDVLSSFPEFEVVGIAPDGKAALEKIDELRPDLVTLDVEMPVMGGLEALSEINKGQNPPKVVMVSAHTKKDAKITMNALELGAFDFITKPEGKTLEENMDSLKSQFRLKIHPLRTRTIKKTAPDKPAGSRTGKPTPPLLAGPGPAGTATSPKARTSIVAIGVSTGGPKALSELIPLLPGDFAVPVVIVQHMPALFTGALAENLDKKSPLSVLEGKDGLPLERGKVYIAPGGKQMKITGTSTSPVIRITDDPPENHCKPSVDYLFRSVGEIFGPHALGVIMTGMGNDGTKGLVTMKEKGAWVLAQDEKTSVVYGMPMEAVKAGVVDEILPLELLSSRITAIVSRSRIPVGSRGTGNT